MSLWCLGHYHQKYPERRDSLVSNSSLFVLSWMSYNSQINWTLTILYGTWHWAPSSLWSIQGNIPCSCIWYWWHLYPYPDCLASSPTPEVSGGYRYHPWRSSLILVCIAQTLWAAIQELNLSTGLSPWWSCLSLQLLDWERVKPKDDATLPFPMVVLCMTTRGLYLLAELDSVIHAYDMQPFGCYFTIHAPTSYIILVMDLTRLNDWELDNFKAEEDVERDNKDKGEELSDWLPLSQYFSLSYLLCFTLGLVQCSPFHPSIHPETPWSGEKHH